MPGLSTIISTGSDVLAAPLDYQLGDQANYITRRENQTFFSAQNLAKPTSVRTLKFQIGGNAFHDLSTLVFAFRIKNDHATRMMYPATLEAHHLFRRMIIRIAGTMVENKEFFAREEEFHRRLLPKEKRKDLAGMYFGVESEGKEGHDMIPNRLPGNTSKNVLFRPMTSAILNMKKYLPSCLIGSGMTIELELADYADSLITRKNFGANQIVDLSQEYTIFDARCLVDEVTLTSQIQNKYSQLLMDGVSVFIELEGLSDNTVQYFPATASKFSVVSHRQYSMVNTIILTFVGGTTTTTENVPWEKDVNNFYLPASAEDTIASNIVINGVRKPNFDNIGVRQHWNRFLRAVGAYAGVGSSTSVSFKSFGGQGMGEVTGTTTSPELAGSIASNATTEIARSFAVIFDEEKLSQHNHTGTPMETGSGFTVNIEGCGTADTEFVSKVFINVSHNGCLELRNSGCAIYT